MKIAGIVCEYNPFHNGHKHHIAKTKEALNTDGVVAVMSGNFVQRGDTALLPMEFRAEKAIKNGVDLVLEIPPRYVLNSAQFYAYNAVYILNAMGCVDYLSFGSECGSIEKLRIAMENQQEDFKKNIKSGMGYAASISNSDILRSPNNILGVEYLRAIKNLNSKIIPYTLKREAVDHDSNTVNGNFASASFIREELKKGTDISDFIPGYDIPASFLKDAEDLWELISYRLKLGDANDFENILNMSEGLNKRILKFKNSKSFLECVDNVSCKRYTKSRVRRALFSILLNLEKSDIPPQYTRVLALNDTGKKILSKCRKTAEIQIFSRLTKKDIYNVSYLKEELTSNDIIL